MEMEESRIGVGYLSYYDVYWNYWNTLYHLVATNRQHIFRTTVILFRFFFSFKMFLLKVLRRINWSTNIYPNYYFESWTRAPQYIAGVILGWLILKFKNKVHMSWVSIV